MAAVANRDGPDDDRWDEDGRDDYGRIAEAIRFLDDNFRSQPDLDELARRAGLSPWHFQRLFSRWAGVSPKRFLQFLTVDYARGLLQRSLPVLDAAFEAGLSGPSRLHDLTVAYEAVTPGELRRRGEGLALRHGIADSPFGRCGLAMTQRGLCLLTFAPAGAQGDGWHLERMAERWPRARPLADAQGARNMARRIFAPRRGGAPLPLHLRGTNFQLRVWEALLRVPPAAVLSYQELARRAGDERAVRATASAVARNPVSFVVPCHRVILKTGPFHHYAWGIERKRAMLGWEQARFAGGHEAAA